MIDVLDSSLILETNPTNVVAALEMLLEEIEAEIGFVNRLGARAFEGRDYGKAKEALESAAQVTGFRDNADALRRDWENLFARLKDEEGTEARAERRNLGRSRRGLRTREEAHYWPILEALQALGGSAQMGQLLDRVLQSMGGVRSRTWPTSPWLLTQTCRGGRMQLSGRAIR